MDWQMPQSRIFSLLREQAKCLPLIEHLAKLFLTIPCSLQGPWMDRLLKQDLGSSSVTSKCKFSMTSPTALMINSLHCLSRPAWLYTVSKELNTTPNLLVWLTNLALSGDPKALQSSTLIKTCTPGPVSSLGTLAWAPHVVPQGVLYNFSRTYD